MKTMMQIILASLLLLSSCAYGANEDKKDVSLLFSLADIDWSTFTLSSEEIFKEKILRDNGSFAFTTYETKYVERNAEDYSVHVYPPNTSSASCDPNALGIHPSEWKNDGTAYWGKVTYWDNEIHGGQDASPSAECMPPNIFSQKEYFSCTDVALEDRQKGEVSCSVQMRQYEVERGINSAYALCSEREGKRVVVCVQQMTDNPKLAEEIFSTFHWTE